MKVYQTFSQQKHTADAFTASSFTRRPKRPTVHQVISGTQLAAKSPAHEYFCKELILHQLKTPATTVQYPTENNEPKVQQQTVRSGQGEPEIWMPLAPYTRLHGSTLSSHTVLTTKQRAAAASNTTSSRKGSSSTIPCLLPSLRR